MHMRADTGLYGTVLVPYPMFMQAPGSIWAVSNTFLSNFHGIPPISPFSYSLDKLGHVLKSQSHATAFSTPSVPKDSFLNVKKALLCIIQAWCCCVNSRSALLTSPL